MALTVKRDLQGPPHWYQERVWNPSLTLCQGQVAEYSSWQRYRTATDSTKELTLTGFAAE